MPRRAAILLLLLLAVAACSVRPTQPPIPASPPVPTPDAGSIAPATPEPTPTPTPAPTLPAKTLDRAWTVERDGVRLAIELERNPMPAGETTWLTATVTNVGDDEMTWFHDGCAIPVGVWGPMDVVRWRDAPTMRGPAAREFQDIALEGIGIEDGSVVIDFMDEHFLDRKGTFGCADIGIGDPVPAGGSIVRRSAWDGFGYTMLGPPPTGLVHLTAHFDYYWRASDPTQESKSIELPFDVWVTAPDRVAIDPAEAISLALLDPQLMAVVEARDLGNANEPVVRYDPLADVWQVGLLDYAEPPRIHMVLVDAGSGELVGWVERVWDYDTDGFP